MPYVLSSIRNRRHGIVGWPEPARSGIFKAVDSTMIQRIARKIQYWRLAECDDSRVEMSQGNRCDNGHGSTVKDDRDCEKAPACGGSFVYTLYVPLRMASQHQGTITVLTGSNAIHERIMKGLVIVCLKISLVMAGLNVTAISRL